MKTLLVTGASAGIGWALAVRAARAGYGVYAVGRNPAALDALYAKIVSEGNAIAIDACDIAVAANARGVIERTVARFGSLDVLVNNAGFVSAGALAAQSDAELERQFGTHVIGPLALVREALVALRAARGHIFLVGSGVARIPLGGLGAYPPAKAALRSAAAILRREMRREGIAVTYVDPGAVNTAFMARGGMRAAPRFLLAPPEAVARKMLVAIGDRPAELNAVPWQTACVALAERFPRLTELLLARAPGLVGAEPAGTDVRATVDSTRADAKIGAGGSGASKVGEELSALSRVATSAPPPISPAAAVPSEPSTRYEAALEPLRRRMEKLNLRESFVRGLLVPDSQLDLGEIALRWAGMPNKNERTITADVLEALVAAGYLERSGEQRYLVVRAPDDEPTPRSEISST